MNHAEPCKTVNKQTKTNKSHNNRITSESSNNRSKPISKFTNKKKENNRYTKYSLLANDNERCEFSSFLACYVVLNFYRAQNAYRKKNKMKQVEFGLR